MRASSYCDGMLASAVVRSKLGKRCVIKTDARVRITSSGQEVALDFANRGQIGFDTTPGAVYRVESLE